MGAGHRVRGEELLARGAELGIPDPAASPPLNVPEWPGQERRWPAITDPGALALRPLARSVAGAVARDLAPAGEDQAVLDVGCGVKPYLPYFAPVAAEYVGLDVEPGPHVDVVSPAETLPFEDERFHAVLSTQTLEHVADPARVVREAHRVMKPGGVLVLSTHGTAAYHPCPTDLWRWTQEGLEKLIRDNGEWTSLRLEATGGTAACFGYLLGFYVNGALQRRWTAPLRKALLAAICLTFGLLDRVVPLHYPRRATLIANFVVVARKSG
jgi:SAM-dependent methyltransferase